jgi:hypothetical protein
LEERVKGRYIFRLNNKHQSPTSSFTFQKDRLYNYDFAADQQYINREARKWTIGSDFCQQF